MVPVTVNNSSPPPPPDPGDFQTLCSQAGVLKCVGFDSAADLAGTGIDVNLLLPGGATRSGMTPDSAPEDVQATWLDPAPVDPVEQGG